MEEEESQAQEDQVDQESLLALRAVKATSDRQVARSPLSCLVTDWSQPKQGILSHFLHKLGAALGPR